MFFAIMISCGKKRSLLQMFFSIEGAHSRPRSEIDQMIHMVRLWYDSEMLGLLVGQRWLKCE